jgi:hypothetical protein
MTMTDDKSLDHGQIEEGCRILSTGSYTVWEKKCTAAAHMRCLLSAPTSERLSACSRQAGYEASGISTILLLLLAQQFLKVPVLTCVPYDAF